MLKIIIQNERKQTKSEKDNKCECDQKVDETLKKTDLNTKKMDVSFTGLKDMIPEYEEYC